MKIYNYHPEYKTYTGASIADESPLEPGVYHIPAHATDIEPPICEKNYVQIFEDGEWTITKDNTGIYYDVNTLEQYCISDPHFENCNLTKEIPPEKKEGYTIKWDNGWVYVEDTKTNLSTIEKLELLGITIDELKKLLLP